MKKQINNVLFLYNFWNDTELNAFQIKSNCKKLLFIFQKYNKCEWNFTEFVYEFRGVNNYNIVIFLSERQIHLNSQNINFWSEFMSENNDKFSFHNVWMAPNLYLFHSNKRKQRHHYFNRLLKLILCVCLAAFVLFNVENVWFIANNFIEHILNCITFSDFLHALENTATAKKSWKAIKRHRQMDSELN